MHITKTEERSEIRVIRWEKEFNYSAINNYGARYANGEYLLFLNNDVTVITEGWLTEMLGMCQRRRSEHRCKAALSG